MSNDGLARPADDRGSDGVWVMTEWDVAAGGYCLAVHFTRDVTHPLTPSEAVSYAVSITEASAAASYDAAVFVQFTKKLKMPFDLARDIFKAMWRRRGRETWQAGPMTLKPGISALTGRAFLACDVDGFSWQWEPAEARQHARQVLEASTAATLDTAYFQTLTEDFDIGMDRATQLVHDLGTYLDL